MSEELKPSENKQKKADLRATNVAAVTPKGGKGKVDFSADERRIANAKNADYDLVGGCGIKVIDKKEVKLPNGLTVRN